MKTFAPRKVRLAPYSGWPHKTLSHAFAAAVLLQFLLCPSPGPGAEGNTLWGFYGTRVSDTPGRSQHISDGAGGTFVAFAHDMGYPNYSGPVYAVRLNAAGAVLWGPVQLSNPGETGRRTRLCSDGSGGVFVAWAQDTTSEGSQVYVQRVNAGGTKQWLNPVPASNPTSIDSLAVAAGNQSMFLVYRVDVSLYAAHINGSGVLAGPGLGGLSLGTARTFGAEPCVVSDGSGGSGVIVQSVVLSSGSLSQAWGFGMPITICSTTGDGYYPALAQDGAGGALISWTEINLWPPAKTDIRVQKVNSSGVPLWTINGVVVVDSSVVGGSGVWQSGETTSTVATDGSGGAYVAWNDWRNDSVVGNDDIYAQRLNASGAPQWASGGISASDYVPGSQRHPAMVSDLAGGALVTFEDYYGPSWDISMVKLTSVGKAWFNWVFWDSSWEKEDQFSPAIIYDASGPVPKGCIVVWRGEYEIAAQKVQIGAGSAVSDTDGDGYSDAVEIQVGSDSNSATSIPNNVARRMNATGILGTMDSLGGTATPVFHVGTAGNINDGDVNSRVDTWNNGGTDPLSYVGILWGAALPSNERTACLRLDVATFFDGGWFGPNNVGPGVGGLLSSNFHLTVPSVQVTTDGGANWTSVGFTSDYLATLHGHALPNVAYVEPTSATVLFVLTPPRTGVNGVRIVGSEGGTGSGGFLGVFELAALSKVPVRLLHPRIFLLLDEFRFQFDTQEGVAYLVQGARGSGFDDWITLQTIEGDGARKTVIQPYSSRGAFYRVVTE